MKRCRACLTVNSNRRLKCEACGRKLPARSKPKHLVALELDYEFYIALNGGEHCGICRALPKPGKKLHRDHDHRTGKPRGLLDFRCNAALRSYMTAEWCDDAASYLRKAA